MKKVCVVTGTRAEYGLLLNLLNKIKADPSLTLQLIATGMHLSPDFGLTYQDIITDGFVIDKKVEMLTSSDTSIGISKSISLGIVGMTEAFEELSPDLLILVGDRFEILSAAIAAMNCNIPIAHIHGGETSEGVIDEAIRHSITKMSHLHFVACNEYKKRVIQLGEHPSRVFTVGALCVDNILNQKLLTKTELENRLGFKFKTKNLIITYHPVTLENDPLQKDFGEVLKALHTLNDTLLIFTKPNSDKNGKILAKMLDQFTTDHHTNSISFTSMGMLNYLSTLQFVDGVVGNSSSGIIEAPYFKTGTINIGERQKGRHMSPSIINCPPNMTSLLNAISTLYSDEFRIKLQATPLPFGTAGVAEKIIQILIKTDLSNLLKKSFYNINYGMNYD